MKKILLPILFITISLSLFGQKDYFINEEGDTVYCDIELTPSRKMKVKIEGKTTTYSAKNLDKFFMDGSNYVSGRVAVPTNYGMVSWSFLKVHEIGEMSLYTLARRLNIEDKAERANIIELNPTYYIKMGTMETNDYVLLGMSWKKKMNDLGSNCNSFIQRVNAVSSSNIPPIAELVTMYNKECGI